MALAGAVEAPAAPAAAPSTVARGRGLTRGRRSGAFGTAVLGLLLLTLGMTTSQPALILLALALSMAAVLARWLPRDAALPFALLAMVLAATSTGMLSHAIGIDLLQSPRALQVAFLTCSVLAVLAAPGAAAGSTGATRVRPGPRLAAYVPAALAASMGLAQELQDRLATSWAFFATDFAHHLGILARVQQAGGLDYSTDGYPRGWHMLMALLAEAGGVGGGPTADLEATVQLWAAATWFAVAALLCAASAVTLRMGERLEMPAVVVVGAAALLGLVLLLVDSFIIFFVFMGAAPSLLGVMVLWCIVLCPFVWPSSQRRGVALAVVIVGAGTALAHLWQALVIVPAAAAAVLLVPTLSQRPRVARLKGLVRTRASWWLLALPGAVFLAVTPLRALAPAGGIGVAGIGGTAPNVPTWMLPLGMLGVALLLRYGRRTWSRCFLGCVLGFVGLVAAMLTGAGGGLDLTQYYPMKALWFLALFVAPPSALVICWAGWEVATRMWTALARLGGARRIARFVSVAVIVALAFAYLLPLVLVGAGASRIALTGGADEWQRRYDIAAEQGARYQPAVTVPVAVAIGSIPDSYSTFIVSTLMTLQTGQRTNYGLPEQVCADVAAVAAGSPAVVITDLEPRDLRLIMEEEGCGDLPVVQLDGGSPAGVDLMGALIRRAR